MRNTQTVLIIGGDVRHSQLDKLRAALCGIAVEWIPTRESDPGASRFEAQLRRQGTSLVVVLCGLIRHQHARDIARLCRRHGQRLLRLHRSANIRAINSMLFGAAASRYATNAPINQEEVRA